MFINWKVYRVILLSVINVLFYYLFFITPRPTREGVGEGFRVQVSSTSRKLHDRLVHP